MSNAVHTLEVLDGSSVANSDRVVYGNFPDIANVIGAEAGAAVTKEFAFSKPIKAKYSVQVTSDQDAVCFVTLKTATGFTVTLSPRLASATLAVGKLDILVMG